MTSIEDVVEDLDHRAFGVAPPENQALNYGYDGNGNMAAAGPNTFDYNILNLPIEISGPGGTAYQEYVSSGGKYKKIVEPTGGETDTIYYLGGVEFINGLPDNYFFGDGRIAWEETSADTLKSWYQYRLTDHLGNTMVFFDDKDEDGQIMTELQTDDPEELEVRQRLWYYPFGMQMDGIVADTTEPHHAYRYNGKELDGVSQTYEYGFRFYDPTIGRFTGVDPIADQFAWVSPFNYAENEPVANVDLHGLQRYYAASGDFIAEYGDSDQKRIINQNIKISGDSYDFNFLYENSSEVLSREGVDKKMGDFIDNYRNADTEHSQIFYSKILADNDGTLFKGYIAGDVISSGEEGRVGTESDPRFAGMRKEIGIHNHPLSTRHRFSKAQSSNGYGPTNTGDFYMGVTLQMDMFLTTKNQNTVLKFDHKKFYQLLKADYEKYNNTFRGQKVSRDDMNDLGEKAVSNYRKLRIE